MIADDTQTLPKRGPAVERRAQHSSAPIRIDRFVVIDRLGAGAMGVVYAAYDTQLDRKVAIKLIAASDATPDGQHEQRLAEARALARVDHQNVVPVYEAGTHEDAVFVVMRHVEGAPLSQWASQAPRSWRAITQAFLAAGRGLEAVHRAGLLHRDFKPDNVLIDNDGHVFIADFGLAHMPRASLSTPGSTAQLAGTPPYMAPELFEGSAADPRTDQYAFCVSFHELLLGRRPTEDSTRTTDANAGGERQAPDWLLEIVTRGLADDPARRWPSMTELLAVLERKLERPRRPLITAAAVLLAVGAAAFAGWSAHDVELEPNSQQDHCVATWTVGDIWNPEHRAELQSRVRTYEQGHAAELLAKTEAALDKLADNWTQGAVDACMTTAPGLESITVSELRSRCYARSKDQLREIVDTLKYGTEKTLWYSTNAVISLDSAIAECADPDQLAREREQIEDSDLYPQREQLFQQLEIVHTRHLLGDTRAALTEIEQLVAAAEAGHDDTLLARALELQGTLRSRTNHPLAVETLTRAYQVAGRARLHDVAANSARRIAHHHSDNNQHDLAQAWVEHAWVWALADGRSATRLGVQTTLGVVARYRGDYDQALTMFEEALVEAEQLLGPEHPNVAALSTNVGLVQWDRGELEAAKSALERALAIYEENFGRFHPRCATALNNLGLVELDLRNFAVAEQLLRAAAAVREAALGERHPDVGAAWINIGNVYRDSERHAEAVEHYRHAIDILPPEHPNHVDALLGLSECLSKIGVHDEARAAIATAHRLRVAPIEDGLARAELSGAYEGDAGRLGDIKFVHAMVLVADPSASAADRTRALELAKAAQSDFEHEGERRAKDLEELQQWLARVKL